MVLPQGGDTLLKSSGFLPLRFEVDGCESNGIKDLLVLEHTPDAVQKFAHDGDQSDELLFALIDEVLVVSLDRGIKANSNQCRHIQCGA